MGHSVFNSTLHSDCAPYAALMCSPRHHPAWQRSSSFMICTQQDGNLAAFQRDNTLICSERCHIAMMRTAFAAVCGTAIWWFAHVRRSRQRRVFRSPSALECAARCCAPALPVEACALRRCVWRSGADVCRSIVLNATFQRCCADVCEADTC